MNRLPRILSLALALTVLGAGLAFAADITFEKAGQVVAGVRCATETPSLERTEQIQIDELTEAFAASGYRVKDLLVAIALSEGFRTSRGLRAVVTMEEN